MRSRGRRLSLSTLAVTLAVGLAGPLATATPARAGTPAGQVLSTASVPGSGLSVDVARNGRRAAVLSARGAHGRVLTSYALRDGRTTRLGSVEFRTSRPQRDKPFVRVSRDGQVGFVQVGRSLAVYDLSHRTPRRTALLGGASLFPDSDPRELPRDVLFAPGGTRAYVTSWERVRVLDLTRPRHPALGVLGATPGTIGDDLTPDGTQLLAPGQVPAADRPPVPESWDAVVATYDLDPATGAPTLRRQAFLDVPGWSPDDSTVALEMVAAPSGTAAYVRAADYGPDADGNPHYPPLSGVVRVQLSDLSTDARLTDAARSTWQLLPHPDGERTYFSEAFENDEGDHFPRRLGWSTAALEGRHRVVDVGDVTDAAFSKGGATKGHLYVLSRGSTLRLRELRLP